MNHIEVSTIAWRRAGLVCLSKKKEFRVEELGAELVRLVRLKGRSEWWGASRIIANKGASQVTTHSHQLLCIGLLPA